MDTPRSGWLPSNSVVFEFSYVGFYTGVPLLIFWSERAYKVCFFFFWSFLYMHKITGISKFIFPSECYSSNTLGGYKFIPVMTPLFKTFFWNDLELACKLHKKNQSIKLFCYSLRNKWYDSDTLFTRFSSECLNISFQGRSPTNWRHS